MGVSLYYTATRPEPITAAELEQIDEIVEEYNESFPLDYEQLGFYDSDEADVIVNGSTKLPPDPEELEQALDHWIPALVKMRDVLDDAEWHVHVDDMDMEWDGEWWNWS